jgi:tetratricopeptide (TPR) repeat protein
MDPLARDHLGQVLIEQERIEAALAAYLDAARIGAPQAEAAWFMAGQCFEALDAPERACDAYLTALRLDPLGISTLERLAPVADQIGNSVLARWSEGRLADLRAEQAATASGPKLAAYQQYAGQLGEVS